MNIQNWLRDSITRVRSDGLDGIKESMYPVYKKGLHQVFRLSQSGVPIYDKNWDLLIVLDACRVDLMEEVSPDFEYIDEVGSIRSMDTMTREWMIKNFTSDYKKEMGETIYICGNPMSGSMLDSSDFLQLDEVWTYSWDDDIGTVPPRPITNSAISASRKNSPNNMIVHYMQPHYPFIAGRDFDSRIKLGEFGSGNQNVWTRLRTNEIEKPVLWNSYRENLKIVLDEIKILLNNVDADTAVISSDHGNALGEYGIYGHPIHMPINVIQMVPWIETKAEDQGTHDPPRINRSALNESAKERLQRLGYHS